MDKSKLIQQLMPTFHEELAEHVRALNRDLLALEKNVGQADQAEALKSLFRSAHSLKGAARSVNVALIEGVCHRLEEILSMVREGRKPLTPELFKLLFDTVDGIEETGVCLREQRSLADAPLTALLARLEVAGRPEAGEGEKGGTVEGETKTTMPIHPAPGLPFSSSPVLPFSTTSTSSVRVASEKLDHLLDRISELLTVRRRVQSRMSELAALQEFIEHWESEWRGIEKLIEREPWTVDRGPWTDKTRTTDHGPRSAVNVLRQNGARLRRLKKELDRLARVMKSDGRLLKQITDPLDEEVRAVRMLPFSEACAGLDRLAHDLAQSLGKEAELVIEGGSVALDRSILEGLKDPLRHLVRNAIDHGVETPDVRQQAGKARLGRVVVAAALRGSQVEIVVRDDGQGLNLEAVRDRARRLFRDIPTDDGELARLIFRPGFTTASIITDVSGRGVGLDVVKSRVEALHGTVDLAYVAGGGVSFTLLVPLTLTTMRAVLVAAADQTFAFAGPNVRRLVRIKTSDLRTVSGREMLILGGQPLPFAQLAAVLQLVRTGSVSDSPEAVAPIRAGSVSDGPQTHTHGPQAVAHASGSDGEGFMPTLIVAAGDRCMAFAVDNFIAEQEILIKGLGSRIRRTPYASGATLLPSGKIVLVLNCANLVRSALARSFAVLPRKSAGLAPPARKRLLIAEDSVTTRALEKNILEVAGYDVAVAVDGRAAWQYLQEHDVDLLVSDVEMPNMDGFELAQAVRASPKLRSLPLVLVTAHDSEQDKARGIAVGADAYLMKSGFDQRNLLETIAQLL